MKQRGSFALIMAAAFITTAAPDAQAVNFLWNNTGSQWTSGSSWTNGVAPTSVTSSTTTDDVQFSNYAANNNTVVLTLPSVAVASTAFLAGANAYNVNSFDGTQKLLISKGLTNSSTATQTFNILVENAGVGNTWTQVTGGSLVFNNNVGLTGSTSSTSRTLTLAGGGTFTFNAGITSGTSPSSKLTINNAGGTVNLNAANTMGGGTVITAGQVNFNNAQSLGTGILEFAPTTGTTYGSSILNNNKGTAIVLTGLTGVLWSGVGPAGIQIGTSSSTANNNIDFGSGLVTATTSRQMNIAGTGVTISMGTLTTTGTANSYTFTFDSSGSTGVAGTGGNTIDLDGWKIATSGTANVVHQINGSANVNIGTIENGTVGRTNGVEFNSSGVTRLTGNNTYTGSTAFGGGTNIISGNNSAAVGNVSISGSKTIVRLDNNNAISSSSSLLGAGSGSLTPNTLDLKADGDFTFNSYGVGNLSATAGNNMAFTNSGGSQKTVTFTNANNYITSTAAGERTLANNSSNLLLDFDGNIEIGSTSTQTTTFTGAGNFNVDGNLLDTGVGGSRTLNKKGDGTLTLRGSGNNYRGSTTVDRGRLDLYGNVTVSTNITVSTNGTVSSASVTRPAAATLDVKSGATLLNNSTTTVYSGGNLIVNGNAGNVIVENYGLLGGSGTNNAVTLRSGSLLNPGNSPGTLTANSATVLGNSTYYWQISNSGVGTMAGIDWDLLKVTTLLDMSAITGTGTDKWNLVVTADGAFTGWTDNNSPYEYVFAQAANLSLASGFSTATGTDVTSLFNITASGITSLPNKDFNPSGDFKVVVGSVSNGSGGTLATLNLMAIPEPSTGALLGFGLCGLVVTRLLSRKQS